VTKPDDVQAAEPDDEDAPAVDEGGTPGTVGALDGSAAVGSAGAVSKSRDEEETTRGVPDPNFGPD
jgi:hypothetical protein